MECPESNGHAKTHASASNTAYQKALQQATQDLTPMDPVRLAVSYSFATFVGDVLKSPPKAIGIIQRAVEDANTYVAAHPHEKFPGESYYEIKKLRSKLESLKTSNSP